MTLQTIGNVEFNSNRPALASPAAQTFERLLAVAVRFARAVVSELLNVIAEDRSHGRISRDPRDWERN